MKADLKNQIVFEYTNICISKNRPVTYVGLLYWVSHSHKYRNLLTIADIRKIFHRSLKILPNKLEHQFYI